MTLQVIETPHKRKLYRRKPRIGAKRRHSKTKRSKLIKKADKLYSLFVRQKYAINGIVTCYTCKNQYPIKKIQCGHYIPRGYKYTRWELDNLRPQCFLCNCRMYGQSFIFRKNLVEEIGEARVIEIETTARVLFKEKDEWIQEKIDEIKHATL